MKILHADKSDRIVLPGDAKRTRAWVPLLVTEKELRLVAYEPPKTPPRAKGRVVKGPHGWPVWEGEMVMDPVEAINVARAEDEHA